MFRLSKFSEFFAMRDNFLRRVFADVRKFYEVFNGRGINVYC
jgi:hypothetical protein